MAAASADEAVLAARKFFHIFQRPAQLGVSFCKDVGSATEPAHCRRCNHPFTSKLHIEDLSAVERELGYCYEVDDPEIQHYPWVCPPCRRVGFALAPGRLWRDLDGDGFGDPAVAVATSICSVPAGWSTDDADLQSLRGDPEFEALIRHGTGSGI